MTEKSKANDGDALVTFLEKGAGRVIAPSCYRSKEGEVEAIKLSEENGRAVWEWADSKPHYGPDGVVDGLTIWTPEGWRIKAAFGDWIVRFGDGFRPMNHGLFMTIFGAEDGHGC